MLVESTPIITKTDRLRLELLIAQLRSLPGPYAGHLAELEQRMRQASIVVPTKVDPEVITMNSRFVARDTHTGKTETFTLVYRSKDGGVDGSVSVFTPLGASLLGARVGDTIEWRFYHGVRELVIEKVLYQPESAGDFQH
jgi:regulator of nucleoside diphosphate kinase